VLDGRDLTFEEPCVVTRDGDAQVGSRPGQVGLDRAVERQLALRRGGEPLPYADGRELVDRSFFELLAADLDE